MQERVRAVVQRDVRATFCEVQVRLSALARENDRLRTALVEHSDICFRSLVLALNPRATGLFGRALLRRGPECCCCCLTVVCCNFPDKVKLEKRRASLHFPDLALHWTQAVYVGLIHDCLVHVFRVMLPPFEKPILKPRIHSLFFCFVSDILFEHVYGILLDEKFLFKSVHAAFVNTK